MVVQRNATGTRDGSHPSCRLSSGRNRDRDRRPGRDTASLRPACSVKAGLGVRRDFRPNAVRSAVSTRENGDRDRTRLAYSVGERIGRGLWSSPKVVMNHREKTV